MSAHLKRPAIAALGLLALLSLTACTDPNALGAIPIDAPIDTVAEPRPTETPDDWFSAPVTEEPDWEGMPLGELKINGDEYSYLEIEGEEPRFLNVTQIPFNMGDAEPHIDTDKPFYVEFSSACRTNWSDPSAHKTNEQGLPAPPKFSMFIAESENAMDGVPLSCTTDNMNYEGEANSWAWFTPREFSDGRYFIITRVEGSRWRQVAPLTISTGILDKQDFGLLENGIGHDDRARALPGEIGEISWLPLVDTAPVDAEDAWWKEPKHEKFFTASKIRVTGSGTNSDPVTGSFELALKGEHRKARDETWVLGRDKDSTSGPPLSCSQEPIVEKKDKDKSKDDAEPQEVVILGTRYKCSIDAFVDDKGTPKAYYLILTSEPGDVRQVIKLPVK